MAGVRVVTDSSCDLPNQLVADLGIEVVPLSIRFGDEEFVDRRDLSPKEFWSRCNASPVLPATAAPPPGAFEDAFRRAANEGADGIVCICLSSKLSATIQSAEVAAKSVQDDVPVRVIDSLSLTMGLGQMTASAARRGAEGASLDEVAAVVEDLIPRVRVYAALDTLENLKKGGRIGGAQAFLGSMLSIKPIIQVVNGEVDQESKQRTRTRALGYLIDKVKEQGSVENLAVMHGDAPDIDEFLDRLSPLYPRDVVVVGDLGAVIGSHAGPRTIGITFQVPK
jgi:DegV family protein with EDD domain